jgi:hypothetical protein
MINQINHSCHNTNLTILSQSVRTSDNLFSLNDLHKAAGKEAKHQPNRFLRLETTQDLINEISTYPDLGSTHSVRNGKGSWVCKELVYAYAMWISAKFHLQVIRAFDSLMTFQPLTLTSAQKLEIRKAVGKKAHSDGETHKRVYHAIYDHFCVSEYGDLLQDQFEEAIAFIKGLDITPRVQTQLPLYSTRVLLCIENGTVTQSQVPDDAFVFSKSRLPSFLKEPGIFTLQEMAQIAEAANKRMVEIAMHASNDVPKQLPN